MPNRSWFKASSDSHAFQGSLPLAFMPGVSVRFGSKALRMQQE